MSKNGKNLRARRTLLCLLLALMLAVSGAAAELDLAVDIGEALEFDAGQEQAGEGPELGLPDEPGLFPRDAEENNIDLTPEELILDTDPLETLAYPAPRTASDPGDFEIDENGVLTKYTGAGGDVVIPEGVTSIGNYAFYICSSLTSVTIPESVTSIEDNAFEGCDRLTNVTIPESVTSIGVLAFYGCSSLTGMTIPESVTSIGYGTFQDCSSLTSVTIPVGVTSIGDYTFYHCDSLTSMTIPEGVISIGNYALYSCGNLTNVTIPESVTGIGEEAFSGCRSLTSVAIPEGVTSIGPAAFGFCDKLEAINVAVSNPAYTSSDGILYTRDMKTLVLCPGAKMSMTIPESVTTIGKGAFSCCSSLTSVTIPESVTSIGDWAFYGCFSLTNVTIPEGVTSIGNYVFYMCSSLTSVTIPESVTSIEDWTFYGCSSLTSVTIPESATSIGSLAFGYCSSLTSVTIPESVTSIEDYAFESCDNLTIYGKAGSYAETYASENGIPFAPSAITPEADSVSIDQGQAATLYAGQTLQLTAVVAPADLEATLTWSSSRKSVATVSSKGLVKAVRKGTATVTVKTGNGKKASIRITVPEAPTRVKLSKAKAMVVVGATLKLKARLNPTTARTALTWSSGNKKVATVSDEGVVKALKKGTATITVTTSNGKKATCKVTVPAAPTKVKFAKKSYSVKVGKSITLKTGLIPASALTVLTFSTSNKKIATVTNNGVVKGIKKGTATITVKTANGKKATVKVTVK